MSLDDRSTAFAMYLAGANYFQLGSFRWKLHEEQPDLPDAPFKVNFREPTTDNGTGLRICSGWLGFMFHATHSYAFEYIAGVPAVGDIVAAAAHRRWPGAEMKPVPKLLRLDKWTDGDSRLIASHTEEIYPAGGKVMLCDDVLSQGQSKKEAYHALREKGMTVTHLAVIVDHELGGREEMEKLGIQVFSLFTISQLLNIYRENDLIQPATIKSIERFLNRARLPVAV